MAGVHARLQLFNEFRKADVDVGRRTGVLDWSPAPPYLSRFEKTKRHWAFGLRHVA